MQAEVQGMLLKQAIQETTPGGQGLVSTLFLMPKDSGQRLIIKLENLGFAVSKAKCQLDPTQTIEFLGFSVNSLSQELSLPSGKLKKIWTDTRALLEGRQVLIGKLSQLLGKHLNSQLGVTCEGVRTGGPWSPEEGQCHINCLEVLAAFHALKCFVSVSRSISVLLRLDTPPPYLT